MQGNLVHVCTLARVVVLFGFFFWLKFLITPTLWNLVKYLRQLHVQLPTVGAEQSGAVQDGPPQAVGIRVRGMQQLRSAIVCGGGRFVILIYVARYAMCGGGRGVCTSRGRSRVWSGLAGLSRVSMVCSRKVQFNLKRLQDLQQVPNTVKTLFSPFTAAITSFRHEQGELSFSVEVCIWAGRLYARKSQSPFQVWNRVIKILMINGCHCQSLFPFLPPLFAAHRCLRDIRWQWWASTSPSDTSTKFSWTCCRFVTKTEETK